MGKIPRGIRVRLATVVALGAVPLLGGCGTDSSRPKPTKASTTDTDQNGTSEPTEIKLSGLSFGPYLAKDLGASLALGGAESALTSTKEASLEFGYIDMRRQKDGNRTDITDFRYKAAAAINADGALPVKAQMGCQAITIAKPGAGTATKVTVSGAVSKSLAFDSTGIARLEDRDGTTAVDTSQILAATFTAATGETVATVQSPVMPTAGAIQLGGAFSTNVTVNTEIKDLGAAMATKDKDLTITDVGTAKDYNLVVVTLYGGSAAKVPYIRCLLPPKGGATVATALYADLLPIKGITGFFANVVVDASGDTTTWASAIAGQGAEDLLVP